jgi:hypothetical protein
MGKKRFALAVLINIAGVALAVACSSDPEDTPTGSCTAGATRACVGANNCTGTQTCAADGKTFSACTCGGAEGGIDGGGPIDTGVDTGVDAGEWTPRKIVGLSLWLDGSLGVVADATKPGKISKWQDRSGNNNNAEPATLDPATIDSAVINGKGAIRCDNNTYLSVKDHESLKFGAGDYGVITVAKATVTTQPPAGPSLFEKGVVVQVTGEKTFRLVTPADAGGGEAVVSPAPVDKFAIYVARGNQLEVRAGGNKGTGPKTTINVTDTAPVYICRGTASAFTSIAELIVVKGALADADINEAEKYLKAKYGL